MTQNLSACLLLQQGSQLACGILSPQQRQQIHRGIPLVAVVNLAIHVDGHIGNHQQISVNVHQLLLNSRLRLHQHPSGDGQGAIQPWCAEHTAVAFHSQPGIGSCQLPILLDLEGGAVRMAGADKKSAGSALGNAEGQHRRTAPGQVIFSAGNQIPALALLQTGIARLNQRSFQICRSVVYADGGIQKIHKRTDLCIHSLPPFFFILHEILRCVNLPPDLSNFFEIFQKLSHFLVTDMIPSSDCFGFILQTSPHYAIIYLSHMAPCAVDLGRIYHGQERTLWNIYQPY